MSYLALSCSNFSYALLHALSCILFYVQSSCISHFWRIIPDHLSRDPQNGITDVQVISTPGQLTDHYDPVKKTVNLSESVYAMNSVAAAAVAAHECGHAVQHQQAYVWLGMRSKMVPVVEFSSKMLNYVMILGLLGIGFMHNLTMLWVWVGLFAVTTLFSFITLPVEFDASRRALVWMESSEIASSIEHDRAKNALFWAAMTYVAAAIGSLAQLLYFLMMALGRRN